MPIPTVCDHYRLLVEGKEGRRAVLGSVIIDTTGTGDIVWKSGAPCAGDDGLPAGKKKGGQGGYLSSFYIGGVDQDALRTQGVRVSVREVPEEALEPYRFIRNAKIVFRRTDEVLVSEEDLERY